MNKQSEKHDPFGPFNLNDFKKWMEQQQNIEPKSNMIGMKVESKISLKRLTSHIEVQEGEILNVAREFKSNGGTISDVNGHNLLIEVESGSFIINKSDVKKMED